MFRKNLETRSHTINIFKSTSFQTNHNNHTRTLPSPYHAAHLEWILLIEFPHVFFFVARRCKFLVKVQSFTAMCHRININNSFKRKLKTKEFCCREQY